MENLCGRRGGGCGQQNHWQSIVSPYRVVANPRHVVATAKSTGLATTSRDDRRDRSSRQCHHTESIVATLRVGANGQRDLCQRRCARLLPVQCTTVTFVLL